MRWMVTAVVLSLWIARLASAATHLVGPGQMYRHPGHVPWDQLSPGDVVEIHWRPEPYRFKWALSRRGTAQQPITVRGMRNEKGELPILDAGRAATPPTQNFWSEARGVIKIGGSDSSGDTAPAWIVIENLDIRGARPGQFFLGKSGLTEYAQNASAIYLESGEHITIRNCRLHDSGNGLFVAPAAREILVEGCDIYDNGIEDSIYEHNVYSEAAGMVYQFNRFGPLRAGCRGNNLKDRSAGLVVRYNRIEGGNRELDLVDSQEGTEIRNDPRYHLGLVYGNLLIEPAGVDNNQIIHWGGDSGDPAANRRQLRLLNNTVISTRTGTTVLLKLTTNQQTAEVRNNVLFTSGAGSSFAILDEEGQVQMSANYLKPGWKKCHGTLAGEILASGNIETPDPGFVNFMTGDFRPGAASALRNTAAPVLGNPLEILFEPPTPKTPGVKRIPNGSLDLGCFEGP